MANIEQSAESIFRARKAVRPLPPIACAVPGFDLAAAWDIQRAVAERGAAGGVAIVGRRVAGVSLGARDVFKLGEPCFGVLTPDMLVDDGDAVIAASLIAPRVTGSLAFLMGEDLSGAQSSIESVLAATSLVFPAIDVLDQRIAGEGFCVLDAISDNGLGAYVVLGDGGLPPGDIDLECCGVVVEINGGLATTGAGAASLGHPAKAVAWLAAQLDKVGQGLRAGDLVLTGELTRPVTVKAGDAVRVTIGGLGSAVVRFE